LYGFAFIYLATSILVFFFKNEHNKNKPTDTSEDYEENNNNINNLSLLDSYKIIWRLLCKKPILDISLVLLTSRVFQIILSF
jgi:hypothetical protein